MTIQKNAFFSEIGYENHKQEKAALMKDHFIFNPTWMGTVRILVQHLHQPSHSVKSHILRNFFPFYPNSNNLPRKNTTETLDHNKYL